MKKNFFAALIIVSAISWSTNANAQSVPVPFSNTWYGYNTMTGTQNYFIGRSLLCDIDNDNDSDVVASRFFQGFMGSATGFVVLKNDGTGRFDLPVGYISPATCQYVEAADFNNDGFPDVVVSNTGTFGNGNTMSVYLNLGNGSFGTPETYSTGGGPVGITAADFNGDNKIDIAVANYSSGFGTTISVFLNTNNGVFGPVVNYPAGDGPHRISAGKINQDNFIDLVAACDDGKVNVLLNSGTGDFSNRTEYIVELTSSSFFPSVHLDDIDLDLDIDVLYVNTGLGHNGLPSVGVLKNTGNGFSPTEFIHMTLFSSGLIDVETADLNNDFLKDVVATSTSARATDGFQVALNGGANGFLPATLYSAGQNTADIMLGDADNDSNIDILTADSYSMQITFHKNSGTANFPFPIPSEIGNSIAGSLDAADIDGDNDLDLVASASGRAATGVTVKVLENLGDGNFGPGITNSIRGGGVQAKFRDLNGDHKPDLLFATAINSPPYDFHYAVNNGDGTFGAVQTRSIGSCGWYDIDAFDMDNDGDNDVVITEWLGCVSIPESSKRIYVCLNSGNAVFNDPIIKVGNPQPGPVVGADFNRDGKVDIVTGTTGASMDVLLGNGNGSLMDPVTYFVGSQGGLQDIVAADFNLDGKLDVASSNFWETSTMSVSYGNGDGTFQSATILPSAHSPDLLNVSGITAGDLDNDGDKDIIVGHNASNCFSLYYNNNNSFEYKIRAGGTWGVGSPFFADFDNDSKGDICATGSVPPSGIGSSLIFLKGIGTGVTTVNTISNSLPEKFLLHQNYPNPFNPKTIISFQLPEPGNVKLIVYDIQGREVQTLINGKLNAGEYNLEFDGSRLSSGVYFYTLSAQNNLFTKRMMLLK